MDREQILASVAEIINKSLLKPKAIKVDDRLIEDVGLDSIGFVELGAALEDLYQLDIDDQKLLTLKTVEQVIELVVHSPRYAA